MRKLFRQLTFCFFVSLSAAMTARADARAAWIDTDLALGSLLRDVDDGYALLLAARSPELRIAGVSSSYGNGSLRGATRRTRDSLGHFGLTTKVEPGAASAHDLGRATTASATLAAALRKGKLTYVALGPLTNLATFIQLHPRLVSRIEQVVMIAGRTPGTTLGFGPEKKFRIHDANFIKDPAAVRAVLRSPVPLLLIPPEVAGRLMIEEKDLQRLERSGAAGRYLALKSKVWLWFWTHLVHESGGPIFDAVAILATARPALLQIETRTAEIDPAGDLIVRRGRGRKVQFCAGFTPETKAIVLRRLTAPRAKSSSAPPDR